MLGLTVEQRRQLLDWTEKLWVLLDQDDFNKIAEIFENAVNREECYQEHGESEEKYGIDKDS